MEHHHHHHEHGENPHIWLDPQNAIAMVRAIVEALAEADPANAAAYKTNGAKSETRLTELDRELEAMLSPLASSRPSISMMSCAFW